MKASAGLIHLARRERSYQLGEELGRAERFIAFIVSTEQRFVAHDLGMNDADDWLESGMQTKSSMRDNVCWHFACCARSAGGRRAF
jgi:hypothetical protein